MRERLLLAAALVAGCDVRENTAPHWEGYCAESHTDLQVSPAPGGVKIGSGLYMHPVEVCDRADSTWVVPVRWL